MGKWIIWLMGAAVPLAAQAQGTLAGLDRGMTGPRAQILVLGTTHLSQLPKGFNPAALDGVLERMAAFKPDIITIEDLPGDECDMAARQPVKYGADYCPSTDAARAATGLDIPAALTEYRKILATWPAQPTPAQRRHLAALFLAANERASAYVQWLYLPEAERRAGDGLDAVLVEKLKQFATLNNESYQIAARLAARLGLQRVYPVDNHSGDLIDVADIKAFVRSLEAAWATGGEALGEQEQQFKALAAAPDLLPLYRRMNDAEALRVRADGNAGTAMRGKSPEGYPQIWVAGWEIRNLRMVANIRETFRERPGARVLAIVGATHKPWFDAWLGQLQGVDIADAARALQ